MNVILIEGQLKSFSLTLKERANAELPTSSYLFEFTHEQGQSVTLMRLSPIFSNDRHDLFQGVPGSAEFITLPKKGDYIAKIYQTETEDVMDPALGELVEVSKFEYNELPVSIPTADLAEIETPIFNYGADS